MLCIAQAMEMIGKSFPKCVSGRWGSVYDTVERILKLGPEIIEVVRQTKSDRV